MSRYAEKTDVSSDRSRSEIEKTLARYGANKFMYGWEDGRAIVCFEMNSKRVRFELPLPDRNDREITHTPGRDLERTPPQQAKEYEQRVKQKWRALCLVIKAKLEATETGITTFEEEFLAHIMLPGSDQTVGQYAIPKMEQAYVEGKMVPLLPPPSKGK